MSEHKWVNEIPPNRQIKEISPSILRSFGLTKTNAVMVKELSELRDNPPNIVIATPSKSLKFIQNYFKEQELIKNTPYVMGLGVFQQLFSDPRLGNKKFLKPATIKFKNVYRPYRGEELNNKTLLVFRTGGIGDLLFIQPNLRYLKEKYPTCKINFACGPQYQAMVKEWECVDRVLDLPFQYSDLKDADYHALFEGVIERCKKAENTNAYHLFTEWLGLNLPDDKLLPKQNANPEKIEFCKNKLKEWNVEPNNFILMQLRASSPIRTPNPNLWINLIDKLTDKGVTVILTDSPKQADSIDEFIKQLKNKDKVFNFCRYSLSLDYSIALVKLARLTVGTDSAMNHIAASLNTGCYGIYGPFPGSIRLSTYPYAKWVDAKKFCAPCYIHSQSACPQADRNGFSTCYDNLNLDEICDDIIIYYNEIENRE